MDRISVQSVVQLVAAAGVIGEVQKSATMMEKLEELLENSSDKEITDTFRPANADETKKGLKAPLVEALASDSVGMSYENARKRYSDLRMVAKAYLPHNGKRWTPKGIIVMDANGKSTLKAFDKPITGYHNIVKAASDELKANRQVNAAAKLETKETITIAEEMRRVAAKEGVRIDKLSSEGMATAREQAYARIDAEKSSNKLQKAAEAALKAVGYNLVDDLIDAIHNVHTAWMQDQAEANKAAEVQAADETEAVAAAKEAARAEHPERHAA